MDPVVFAKPPYHCQHAKPNTRDCLIGAYSCKLPSMCFRYKALEMTRHGMISVENLALIDGLVYDCLSLAAQNTSDEVIRFTTTALTSWCIDLMLTYQCEVESDDAFRSTSPLSLLQISHMKGLSSSHLNSIKTYVVKVVGKVGFSLAVLAGNSAPAQRASAYSRIVRCFMVNTLINEDLLDDNQRLPSLHRQNLEKEKDIRHRLYHNLPRDLPFLPFTTHDKQTMLSYMRSIPLLDGTDLCGNAYNQVFMTHEDQNPKAIPCTTLDYVILS
eukprot:283808-Pleurochrysis_carterae.AAC.1